MCTMERTYILLMWYHGDYKMNDNDQCERLYIFWSITSQTLKELSSCRQVLQVLASDNAHLENIHCNRLWYSILTILSQHWIYNPSNIGYTHKSCKCQQYRIMYNTKPACAWPSSVWFLAMLSLYLWTCIILCIPTHALTDLQSSTTSSVPEPVTAGLSAGAVVGISTTIFLVSFSAGGLLAALITYCCCVRRGKSSGQPHPSSSEGPQPAPLYDEVGAGKLEVKENVAYGPVDKLEMKQNPSYGPVRH